MNCYFMKDKDCSQETDLDKRKHVRASSRVPKSSHNLWFFCKIRKNLSSTLLIHPPNSLVDAAYSNSANKHGRKVYSRRKEEARNQLRREDDNWQRAIVQCYSTSQSNSRAREEDDVAYLSCNAGRIFYILVFFKFIINRSPVIQKIDL